ncbi:hypothetical protein GCM10009117_00870 [Gangjinia marincola]|uniref:CAAX prenyl protease 2/Lysostaphin resistance protein A-like domain-containing protein n=1 Tax=Gangjinia marincola TaxID=578463 RepID=A0ABN1MD12_9FLAO
MDVSFNIEDELIKLYRFVKRPTWSPEPYQSKLHKLLVFSFLLVLSLIAGLLLGACIQAIQQFDFFEPTQHEMEKMMYEHPKYYIFLLGVVAAPLLEECIFRGPLLYASKFEKLFPYFFYASVLLFGFVHLSNYQLNTSVLYFAPILVSAQLFTGITFGYIRVKFGLLYSIALHASYNGILFLPFLFFDFS